MHILTISSLVIRLRQTGRTNDRPHNGRTHVTSKSKDRHLRLIPLQNRMITTEATVQTVRRRLCKSGLRARLVNAVVGGFTHGNTSIFSDESRFSLRFSDGRYRESGRFGGGGVMV